MPKTNYFRQIHVAKYTHIYIQYFKLNLTMFKNVDFDKYGLSLCSFIVTFKFEEIHQDDLEMDKYEIM